MSVCWSIRLVEFEACMIHCSNRLVLLRNFCKISCNGAKSDCNVSFCYVLINTLSFNVGFIAALKVLGISCFLDEYGLTCNGFPKFITMLGGGIGLVRVGLAMATKI